MQFLCDNRPRNKGRNKLFVTYAGILIFVVCPVAQFLFFHILSGGL
jgi:hypothetical protein